jgi:predicted RNA-binding protein (TIGR00451 family)
MLTLAHPLATYAFSLIQVDKGAIKHVLAGANVFCGGLVSSGAKMEADLQPGQPVILMAEGKVHACAVRNKSRAPRLERNPMFSPFFLLLLCWTCA